MGDRLRVLHIEDRFHPGMGYQINFFARYHNPSCEFHILTSDSARLWTASVEEADLRGEDAAFEKRFGVNIHRLPVSLDRRGKQNFWLRGLKPSIRKIDPDILYVHTIETYTSMRIILNQGLFRNRKVFFDTHTLLNQFGGGMAQKVQLWFFRNVAGKRFIKYGVKVFATVPENRMILNEYYGIPEELILDSPIGTDLDMFSFSESGAAALRKKEGIPADTTVLLYTGKINPRKRPHLIFEALLPVQDRVKAPLLLCFVGASDSEYFKQFMQSGFSNPLISVKFVPAVPVSELKIWYSMADFAVFPAENTLSSMDAQACRLPVIMQDDSTNRERLAEGGHCYEAGDLGDLANKILVLAGNRELRETMGIRGEAYIRARYDYRNIVRNMESELGIY